MGRNFFTSDSSQNVFISYYLQKEIFTFKNNLIALSLIKLLIFVWFIDLEQQLFLMW